jgi:hypothetical protein
MLDRDHVRAELPTLGCVLTRPFRAANQRTGFSLRNGPRWKGLRALIGGPEGASQAPRRASASYLTWHL